MAPHPNKLELLCTNSSCITEVIEARKKEPNETEATEKNI